MSISRRLRYIRHSTKINTAFLIVCGILLLVGSMGIWGMHQINVQATQLAHTNMPKISNLTATNRAILQATDDLRQSILDADAQASAHDVQLAQQDEQALQSSLNSYVSMPQSADEQQALSAFQSNLMTWQATLHQLEARSTTHAPFDAQLAADTHSQLVPQTAKLLASLGTLINQNQQQGTSTSQNADATATQFTWLLVVLGLLAVVAALVLARVLNVLIVLPLRQIDGIVARMADGELSAIDALEQRYGGTDATGELVIALNRTLGRLRELIGRVTKMSQVMTASTQDIGQVASQTEAASGQVADAIQQVAAGAQEQSEQLNQATVGVNLLASQNATLRQDAQQTLLTMETLKSTIGLTAQRVRKLGEHSATIGQIVQTIDEISEQTNLLALNAAIEAARAGEYGRGFAVVADEVRKLAERASGSAKEISQIVQQTQQQTVEAITAMEDGVQQVEQGVERVAQTEEQTQVMATHALNVEQMVTAAASVSEENSAAAEEVSAATEEMAAQVAETLMAAQKIQNIAEELHQAARLFHWTYEDNWRARGMKASVAPPWHPVPSATEDDTGPAFPKAA